MVCEPRRDQCGQSKIRLIVDRKSDEGRSLPHASRSRNATLIRFRIYHADAMPGGSAFIYDRSAGWPSWGFLEDCEV
jgi:hypothetical protein